MPRRMTLLVILSFSARRRVRLAPLVEELVTARHFRSAGTFASDIARIAIAKTLCAHGRYEDSPRVLRPAVASAPPKGFLGKGRRDRVKSHRRNASFYLANATLTALPVSKPRIRSQAAKKHSNERCNWRQLSTESCSAKHLGRQNPRAIRRSPSSPPSSPTAAALNLYPQQTFASTGKGTTSRRPCGPSNN
jgi:hypothetical protein